MPVESSREMKISKKRRYTTARDVILGARGHLHPDFWKEKISVMKKVKMYIFKHLPL